MITITLQITGINEVVEEGVADVIVRHLEKCPDATITHDYHFDAHLGCQNWPVCDIEGCGGGY